MLWHRGLSPPHCLSKGNTLNPRVFCWRVPGPPQAANSFHFGLLGLVIPFILAFWALISVLFGLLGLDFLVFWPCGPSFPCILALWLFISLRFGFLGFISLHFGLVGLHFCSGPNFVAPSQLCPQTTLD